MRERLTELDFEERDGILIARIEGEIDSSNAGGLALALTDRLSSAARALILDLSAVSYLDSTGVRLLFDLARRLAARRQSLRLVVPEGAPIRRVLDLADVADVAPIDLEVAEAVTALHR